MQPHICCTTLHYAFGEGDHRGGNIPDEHSAWMEPYGAFRPKSPLGDQFCPGMMCCHISSTCCQLRQLPSVPAAVRYTAAIVRHTQLRRTS